MVEPESFMTRLRSSQGHVQDRSKELTVVSSNANSLVGSSDRGLGPSPRIRALVEPLISGIVTAMPPGAIDALAVVGSASRGEETWQNGELMGDIDLAVIVRGRTPLAQRRVLNSMPKLPEKIGMGCFPRYSLSRFRTLELFEAKQNAWVFWGDQEIFSQVPIASSADIPEWEGLRLLFNRAVECLRVRAGLTSHWYAAVKAYLAIGEASLVFLRDYRSSYRGRRTALLQRGSVLGSSRLLDRIDWASAVKLGERSPEPLPDSLEHERWLMEAIRALQSQFLGSDVGLLEGFNQVSGRTHHLVHRGWVLAHRWRQPSHWYPALREDPAFPVWRLALRVLLNEIHLSHSELRMLISAWESTLQPFQR